MKFKPSEIILVIIVAVALFGVITLFPETGKMDGELNLHQQKMVAVFERHLAAEFETKNLGLTMATMTPEPFVNHVPVMTGGVGYTCRHSFFV